MAKFSPFTHTFFEYMIPISVSRLTIDITLSYAWIVIIFAFTGVKHFIYFIYLLILSTGNTFVKIRWWNFILNTFLLTWRPIVLWYTFTNFERRIPNSILRFAFCITGISFCIEISNTSASIHRFLIFDDFLILST